MFTFLFQWRQESTLPASFHPSLYQFADSDDDGGDDGGDDDGDDDGSDDDGDDDVLGARSVSRENTLLCLFYRTSYRVLLCYNILRDLPYIFHMTALAGCMNNLHLCLIQATAKPQVYSNSFRTLL